MAFPAFSGPVRSFWAAVTADARALEAGATPEEMAARPLWPEDSPYKPTFDRKTFLAAAPSFEVWLDWYEPIVEGKAPWGLPRDIATKLEERIALGDNRGEGNKDYWEREADVVNAEIKSWVEAAKQHQRELEKINESLREVAAALVKPEEPPAGPGPQYTVVNGKLSNIGSVPLPSELTAQQKLHERLAKQAQEFAAECKGLSNQHPSLAGAADEYASLLSAQIDTIDVTGVWSIGGTLAGFATALFEQNIRRTLTEPLEPHLAAKLQSIVRQHGAFILGFEEGRDLVNRADEFLVDRNRLEQIVEPGNQLIEKLTTNRELVDDKTIALNQPISDFVHEYGWMAGRNGYSAYLLIRNSVRSIIKIGIGEDKTVVGIFGAVTIAAEMNGMSVREFAKVAIPFIRDYAQTLLQFFAHSPEMRAYVQWAISLIEDDGKRRKETK